MIAQQHRGAACRAREEPDADDDDQRRAHGCRARSLKVRARCSSRPDDAGPSTHRRALRAALAPDRQPGVSAGADDYAARRVRASVRRAYRPRRHGAPDGRRSPPTGDRTPLLRRIATPTQIDPRRGRSAGAVAAGPRPRGEIPGARSTSSTAWATTCRSRCGRASPTTSRAPRRAPERRTASAGRRAARRLRSIQSKVRQRLRVDVSDRSRVTLYRRE